MLFSLFPEQSNHYPVQPPSILFRRYSVFFFFIFSSLCFHFTFFSSFLSFPATQKQHFFRRNAPVTAPSSRSRGYGRRGIAPPPASPRRSGTGTDPPEPREAAGEKRRGAGGAAAVAAAVAVAVGAAAAAAASKSEKSSRTAMSIRARGGRQAVLARTGPLLSSPGLTCPCCRRLWTS